MSFQEEKISAVSYLYLDKGHGASQKVEHLNLALSRIKRDKCFFSIEVALLRRTLLLVSPRRVLEGALCGVLWCGVCGVYL